MVWSTDTVTEDVDFRQRYQTPYQVGWKSWMGAVSDLAAMGAEPRGGLVAASIPPDTSVQAVRAIQLGLVEAAAVDGAVVMGGDVGATPGPLTLTVTVMGEIEDGKAILLSEAAAGDTLVVTGQLGLAAAALHQLEGGHGDIPDQWRERLLRPPSRVRAGSSLRRSGASSMTDLSDGLLLDLGRICQASGVGSEIWLDQLPVPKALPGLELALAGGEDFELLAAVPSDRVEQLLDGWRDQEAPLSVIGMISDSVGIRLLRSPGGEVVSAPVSDGFQHF